MKSDNRTRYKSRLFPSFVASLIVLSASLVSSIATKAQEGASPPIVAIQVGTSRDGFAAQIESFLQAMEVLGYVDGENVRYEYRFGDGHPELYEPQAQELVALNPAVIVSGGNLNARILAAATQAIPLVSAHVSAAQMRNVVQNWERPEGNVTGRVEPETGPAEMLALTKELLPQATRVGYLISASLADLEGAKQEAADAAFALGISLFFGESASVDDVLSAFESVVAEGVEAVVVSGGSQFIAMLEQLAESARAANMPTIYRQPGAVPAGGLISIGTDQVKMWGLAAGLVDRILNGDPVADLPIVQGNEQLLRINQDAAVALGITVPRAILDRATLE